jgi:hypothetical protein
VVLPVERSKVRTLIRTGLVRVLLSLSGFLVRVTGLINSEKNSGQTADDESMNENPDSWPEAWTQRIKSAKHVTWFNFKAQRNAPLQRQRTLKNEALSDKAPMAENRVNQDMDVSMPIHKPHSGARSAPVETIPPISRVFDPRTRLWIYESSGERTSAEPESFPTDSGVPLTGQPGSEKAGITVPALAPFPFQNMESEKPLPEQGVNRIEPLAPSSFDPPGKFREEGPDSDVHINGNLPALDRFRSSPIQTTPRSEVRFTETIRNETKSSAMAGQERPTENVPSYPRWTEIGTFDDPAVRSNKTEFSSFSSHTDMPVKEQGPSPEGFKEEMAPALNRPWPELEEFEFPRDLKEAEHRGDNHDRLLRLKLEQKGSLWSVSRF